MPNSCSVSNIFGGSAHALGRVNILLRSFGRSRPATNVSLPEMEMEMPVNVSVPVCLRDWACCVSACTYARVVHTISLVIAACKTYHQMNMQTPFICILPQTYHVSTVEARGNGGSFYVLAPAPNTRSHPCHRPAASFSRPFRPCHRPALAAQRWACTKVVAYDRRRGYMAHEMLALPFSNAHKLTLSLLSSCSSFVPGPPPTN